MADLIQIDTLTNKYSDNLLTELSLFNEAPTITHVGTGSVTISDDYSVTNFGKSAEVYFVQDVIAGVDETFSFGDALKHTAQSDGNHVFSFQLYSQNINCDSDYYFDFSLNVFVNSVLTETFTKQVFPLQLTEGKFFTFAQSFDLAIGEEVNFSFSFLRPSVGTPNPNFRINLSGFKLELDNKFLFNPTPYSLPNKFYSEKTGWVDVTDITNTQALTANTDNLIQITTPQEENGSLSLLDSNAKITPVSLNDSISVDFSFSFTTPSGTNNYLNVYLKVNGIVYRAHTHAMLKSAGVTDYVSVSFNLPVKTDLFTYGAEFYVNPSTNISITNRYIQVTKIHNGI